MNDLVYTGIVENHMDERMEHDMETGMVKRFR